MSRPQGLPMGQIYRPFFEGFNVNRVRRGDRANGGAEPMSISRLSRTPAPATGKRPSGARGAAPASAASKSFAPLDLDATIAPVPSSPGAPAPGGADGVQSAVGVAGVDAVLALQGGGAGDQDGDHQRRQLCERASSMLDALDDMQVALLGGQTDPVALDRLRRLKTHGRAETGDPGFDALMRQVDVRAAVELAKRETPPNSDAQIAELPKAGIYRPGSAQTEQGER